MRTGKIGIFPLAHVVDVEYNDFDPATEANGGGPRDRKERYLLEYIGSVESHLYKGNAVLCQAVKKILGAAKAPKRHTCVIEISDKGIKMIDKSRMNVRSTDYSAMERRANLNIIVAALPQPEPGLLLQPEERDLLRVPPVQQLLLRLRDEAPAVAQVRLPRLSRERVHTARRRGMRVRISK